VWHCPTRARAVSDRIGSDRACDARARVFLARALARAVTMAHLDYVRMPVYMNNHLFGCIEDQTDCCYGLVCRPCHLGALAQRAGVGNCLDTCCVSLAAHLVCASTCHERNVVQSALYQVGVTAPVGAFACCFCAPCLQCQASREVQDRQAAAALSPNMRQGAAAPQVIIVQAPPVQTM
jgi:hypothetical protein